MLGGLLLAPVLIVQICMFGGLLLAPVLIVHIGRTYDECLVGYYLSLF